MLKIFKLLLLFFFIMPSEAQNKKEKLSIKVLTDAQNYEDIKGVIDIIKKQNKIYNYVPSIHPIAPKSKPVPSSGFGKRFHPIDKVYSFHAGQDFVSEYATTIHATAKGKVIYVNVKGGYGKCIVIEHKFGFKTLYGHLTEYYIKEGESVYKGQIIAFLGNTGKSTGAHLHYEVIKNEKKINPINFIE